LALEDLLVALADKLWKGKRVSKLEQRCIKKLAEVSGEAFWDTYLEADEAFERVAGRGVDRLVRSRGS
ncbi:MAG: phosphohydrolase, partial [Nannocystaceae bacterium]